MSAPLVVYYNSRCPICDAGIAQQRRMLDRHTLAREGQMEWRDINLEPEALAAYGATLTDIRRRLHALDAQGHLLVGVDVALAIMERIPAERWLARLLRLPGLHRLSVWAYDGFAYHLERWNRKKGRW